MYIQEYLLDIVWVEGNYANEEQRGKRERKRGKGKRGRVKGKGEGRKRKREGKRGKRERKRNKRKGKRGKREGKRGKREGKKPQKTKINKKNCNRNALRNLRRDLFEALKRSIILLKSKNFLYKGGSDPPLHSPHRSNFLRSLRGHQKPVKYTCF